MESADEAIASKTLDGIVTSWNPAAETLFGYTAAEIIGRHISVLAAPGREDEMPAILERIRRGEKVERYETVRRRKDGSLVEIALTVSPIRDEFGRIIGASKIARNITEHRRLHEALRASEERFRNLANAVPDIVWTAAPDGSITFANDRWFHYCGITPEQNERGLAGAGAPSRRSRTLSRGVDPRTARGHRIRDRGAQPAARRRIPLVPYARVADP